MLHKEHRRSFQLQENPIFLAEERSYLFYNNAFAKTKIKQKNPFKSEVKSIKTTVFRFQ